MEELISLNDKAEIIIGYFRDGLSLREIGRRIGKDKNTVKSYVDSYEKKLNKLNLENDEDNKKLLIEELNEEPKYDISNRKKRKLSDEIKQEINKMNKNDWMDIENKWWKKLIYMNI